MRKEGEGVGRKSWRRVAIRAELKGEKFDFNRDGFLVLFMKCISARSATTISLPDLEDTSNSGLQNKVSRYRQWCIDAVIISLESRPVRVCFLQNDVPYYSM
jgi:hypothetical protein